MNTRRTQRMRRIKAGLGIGLAISSAGVLALQPAGSEPVPTPPEPPAQAEQPAVDRALPDAASVFARCTEAMGGAEAILARKVLMLDGSLTSADKSFFALISSWNVAPNKMRMRMEVPGGLSEDRVFNGEYAWSMNSNREGIILTDHYMLDLAQSADMHVWAELDRVFQNAHTMEFTDLRGKPCIKVGAESIYGQIDFLYFEVETGLLRGIQTRVAGGDEGEQVPLLVIQEDFKEIGGVMTPMKVTQEDASGAQFIIKFSKGTSDVPESEMPDLSTPQWLLDAVERMKAEQPEVPPQGSTGG